MVMLPPGNPAMPPDDIADEIRSDIIDDTYRAMWMQMAGYLAVPLVELADRLTAADPVLIRPADDVIFSRVDVDSAGGLLVGSDVSRARTTVVNVGTTAALLWSTGDGRPSSSFPLGPGASLTLPARCALSVRAAVDGERAQVAAIVLEHRPGQ